MVKIFVQGRSTREDELSDNTVKYLVKENISKLELKVVGTMVLAASSAQEGEYPGMVTQVDAFQIMAKQLASAYLQYAIVNTGDTRMAKHYVLKAVQMDKDIKVQECYPLRFDRTVATVNDGENFAYKDSKNLHLLRVSPEGKDYMERMLGVAKRFSPEELVDSISLTKPISEKRRRRDC